MVSFFIRFLFVVCVIALQISFLNVSFIGSVPNVVLMVAIVWTLIRNFLTAWPWIVGLGLVYDTISMGAIGTTSLALILFSYGVSFLSRRFLVEHRGFGMMVGMVYAAIASIIYHPIEVFVRYLPLGASEALRGLVETLSFVSAWTGAISNALIFILSYFVVLRMERALSFYDDQVIVKR